MADAHHEILQQRDLRKIASDVYDLYLPKEIVDLVYSFIRRSKYVTDIMWAEEVLDQWLCYGYRFADIVIIIPLSNVKYFWGASGRYINKSINCTCNDDEYREIQLEYRCMDYDDIEYDPDNTKSGLNAHTVPLLVYGCLCCGGYRCFDCKTE